MSNRKITFIVVALIVLLGGSAALSYLFIALKPEPKRKPDIQIKRFVKAETTAYTKVISPLSAKGRVVSSSEVMLVSEAAGKIQKGEVNLRKGTSFKKGQLLAEIYKDEVELALKARKSQFLTTISTLLPDLKVDFEKEFPAFLDFFNAIDMNKELPALPSYSDGKLKIFLASRNFLSEYYGIQQDEKKLKRHSLYAPFNGTFTAVNFEVGGYVNIGGQIATMIRTDELEVEVPVKNEQSRWIEIGDTVRIFNRDNQSVSPGVVVRKSDFIEANTQSRSVFVKVASSVKNKLLTGEYKEVVFPGQVIDKAMELPRNAVFNSNEVFVVVDGKLKIREINVLKWNETTLIFNGLKEGEKVVTEPLINVKENTPVGILGEEEVGSKENNKQRVSQNGNHQSKEKQKQ